MGCEVPGCWACVCGRAGLHMLFMSSSTTCAVCRAPPCCTSRNTMMHEKKTMKHGTRQGLYTHVKVLPRAEQVHAPSVTAFTCILLPS